MCVALEGATSLVGCQPLAPAGAQSFLAAVDHVPAGPYTVDAWVARGEGGGRRPGREACGGRVVIGGAEARLCDLAPEGPSCDDPRATSLGATLAGHDATFAVTTRLSQAPSRMTLRRRVPGAQPRWGREPRRLRRRSPQFHATTCGFGSTNESLARRWRPDDDVGLARRLALDARSVLAGGGRSPRDDAASRFRRTAAPPSWLRTTRAVTTGQYLPRGAARGALGAAAAARPNSGTYCPGPAAARGERSWQPVPRRRLRVGLRHAAYQAVTGTMGYKAPTVRDEWRAPLRHHGASSTTPAGGARRRHGVLRVALRWTRLTTARSAATDAQDQRDRGDGTAEFEEAVLRGLDAQVMAAHGDDGLAAAGGGAGSP